MSYRNHAKDTRKIFNDPNRVLQLLDQIAEESNTKDTGKQKGSKQKSRDKPKSERAKKSERIIKEQPKGKVEAPAQEVQPKVEPSIKPKAEAETKPAPTQPKTKLETPAPKPAPKIKRAVADDAKLAYIITAGPILSQIHYAFDHAADTDAEAIVFALEERIYRPKGKPKVERTSVLRMRVLDFGYDGSPEPKRWHHLVITGEVDLLSQHLAEVPYYPDGTPFVPGARIKLFYNLEARCGAIIAVETNEKAKLLLHVPEDLDYVAAENF